MSSPTYNDDGIICCDGSFANAFKGPFHGLIALLVAILAIIPVIFVMIKIYRERQEFLDELPLNRKEKFMLLYSGISKIATRLYAGLFAAAAAGSSHLCNPNAGIMGACLNNGYSLEAFILGFSSLAAGIFDWMTLVRTSPLPFRTSLSGIRWAVIDERRCVLLESLVLAFLFFLLALFGVLAHIGAANDAVGLALSIPIGIWVVPNALFIVFGLIPQILCQIGILGSISGEYGSGTVMHVCWQWIDGVFMDLPGIVITAFSTPGGLIGWIIDSHETLADIFFKHHEEDAALEDRCDRAQERHQNPEA